MYLTRDLDGYYRTLYDEVVRKTGGAVIFVKKSEISAGTAIMEATTTKGLVSVSRKLSRTYTAYKVGLLEGAERENKYLYMFQVTLESRSSFRGRELSVDIDSHISSLLVQFTGDFVFSGVTPESNATTNLVSISGTELFQIDDVKPGQYTFRFESTAETDFGYIVYMENSPLA